MTQSNPASAASLSAPGSLFARLRADTPEWGSYIRHPFLAALANGSLPLAGFRNYLVQDYLYLIQYARAYALGVYKSESLAEMRASGRVMRALLDTEMPLHVEYCAAWGITQPEMEAAAPDLRMLAYTRFFLERGMAGDKLDLDVALIPCVVGYAEIATNLMADPATVLAGNPYAKWIETYAGEAYQGVAAQAIVDLETLGAKRGAEARYPSLLATFRTATMLEAEFWGIGWPAPATPHG